MTHSIFGKYQQWRRFRRTYRELSTLTDRELNDLGISRFDLQRVAKNAAR